VLVVLHVYGMDYGLSKIHMEIPGHNTYLTGLSIAGGMALFSPAIEVRDLTTLTNPLNQQLSLLI
jgi:hypothetical protein